MARQPGTKADDNLAGSGLSRAIGRGLGFIVLAGLGMAIFAALVLMPAWASLVRAEHELALKRANTEHDTKMVAARARRINALPHDRVLVERYAKGMVRTDPMHASAVKLPPEPGGWMMGLADKLTQQKTRRGLFFVACVSLAGAMFLFAPPTFKRASHCHQET